MAIPFLKLEGFSEADIGFVQGGWRAIAATVVGAVFGGFLFRGWG
jgi:hypothetical protein